MSNRKKLLLTCIIVFIMIFIFQSNTIIQSQTDQELIYLTAFGDSTPAGLGVKPSESYVRIYSEYVEEDLKVEVEVNNWAEDKKRNISEWVHQVTTNEEFRDDLEKADIITIWIGWHEIMPYLYKTDRVYKKELNMTTNRMGEQFDLLFDEITRLAEPKNTLIIVSETGIPPAIIKTWKDIGHFQELKQYAYEDWRKQLIQAAKKHNVKVVPTYKTLNGKQGNSNLPDIYFQEDKVHFSIKGHKLLADIHRNLGYDPIK